ncbi:uncharacterized protein G2W53_024461 [Senna tora]|uniref:Uncharacterized protein n=1 Tax=Senna tora TaxID=362788 RepID=A0A834WGZ2_9FABA|nr:uncharacterized protein G2W53_024461 [Senna tora]
MSAWRWSCSPATAMETAWTDRRLGCSFTSCCIVRRRLEGGAKRALHSFTHFRRTLLVAVIYLGISSGCLSTCWDPYVIRHSVLSPNSWLLMRADISGDMFMVVRCCITFPDLFVLRCLELGTLEVGI